MYRDQVAKLVTPCADHLLRRSRVLGAVRRGLKTGACWIAAPAGHGKTTALADYVARRNAPHIWYRVDEGDQDIASFFHYLALAAPRVRGVRPLPVFGPEYAEDPEAFAHRFFAAWLARLDRGTLLVLDDLHRADAAGFRSTLATLLGVLPAGIQCACLSRTSPWRELQALRRRRRLAVLDQSTLRFSEREARALVSVRLQRVVAALDVRPARGWAAGLVLLSEHAAAGYASADAFSSAREHGETALFVALVGQVFDSLPWAQRQALLRLSLLPDIQPDIARALVGAEDARALFHVLGQRQLLVTRGQTSSTVFHFHDLLKDFLRQRMEKEFPADKLARMREQAAIALEAAGHADVAVDLALQAAAWPLSHRLIVSQAEALLAQGRRATFVNWCRQLPPDVFDGWLCYWLGVANMSEDAAAESWFARAWEHFCASSDLHGRYLTAARAVLCKVDSWRTHEGLSTWTGRIADFIGCDPPALTGDQQILIWTGMLRAIDFSSLYRSDAPPVVHLIDRLLDRLKRPQEGDSITPRLMASGALIDHAGASGRQDLFEQAVDCVRGDLRATGALPWALGNWLVTFGAVSGRYFVYARRGFPHASAEEALRAAISLGERESLRGVEFGALYHLQHQMKVRNDLGELSQLIRRLAEIADSRFTTQVAVLADCQAALRTMQGNFAAAYRACEQFTTAIEAANEPPIERWPHFITQFQVLLADRRPDEAAAFLQQRLSLFHGGLRQRTLACVAIARAFAARWSGDTAYPECLRECIGQMQAASWPAILLNLPDLLAELCADALEHGIGTQFCRELIRNRALRPPQRRPAVWPWKLRVHLLGGFRLEVDGRAVDLGVKPPSRSLDIVRLLAVSREQACALQRVWECLWPDADGDQAKAACDQALHRLRKLLGVPDLVVQREGRLSLPPETVWIDLVDWESRLARALRHDSGTQAEQLFHEFPGPLLPAEGSVAWMQPAAERVRAKFIELALRVASRPVGGPGSGNAATNICLRALESYPTSERCYEALLRARLAAGDTAGALEDYRRYERVLESARQGRPPVAIRTLLQREIDGIAADN